MSDNKSISREQSCHEGYSIACCGGLFIRLLKYTKRAKKGYIVCLEGEKCPVLPSNKLLYFVFLKHDFFIQFDCFIYNI